MISQKDTLFPNSRLIRLIIPLVIEQGLTVLVGMCDGVMVSSVGEAAISGVSLVDMFNNVVLVLFAALATGGAVVTSQYLGACRPDQANRSVGQLIVMSLVFGIASAVFCLVLARPLMRLFYGSIDQDVMDAGLLYFRITALSYPFIALYNAGAAVFRSVGNSKISMKVSMMMNVINVAGNALCILVLKMGVAGVAVPTLISRAVAAWMILYLAAKPGQELRLQSGNLRSVQWDMMQKILHIGIPSAFENSLFQLGRVVVVSMIALFGTTHTTANAIANNLDGVGCIIGQAMGLAMVTVVGQCVGAGDMKQTVYNIKKLMLWAYLAQGAGNVLIILYARQLVGCYRMLSPETFDLAVFLTVFHAAFALFMWPSSFVLPNALRAANDVRFTMVVSIVSMALWRVGLSYVLCVRCGLGAVGVWYAMAVDWTCRISFFIGRTVSGKWKSKYVAD